MANFLKGIVIGLGGIAPGLSGSVLLVIFGLYQKTIASISAVIKDALTIVASFFGWIFNRKERKHSDSLKTAWKDFLEKMIFLIPLFIGMGIGVVLFGKLVDYLLANFEMYTRFAFFGLIAGTIPLFYREVRKEGYQPKYYIAVALAAAVGIYLFYFTGDTFAPVTNPNLFQSAVLGFAVAGSSIVPGVDSAAILSAVGLYELYVSSIANLDFAVLIPAGVGLVLGVAGISLLINMLMSKYYTWTFSVIFGLFLTIIPTVFNESCVVAMNVQTVIAFVIMIISFFASLLFSNLEQLKDKLETKNK